MRTYENRMKPILDENGQPLLKSQKDILRLNERKVDEIIGICKGMVADNDLSQQEIDFLCQWTSSNRLTAHTWPVSKLCERIQTMLVDGKIDEEEKKDLLITLKEITGEINENRGNKSTRLPLTEPPPPITFEGQNYCFTGRFITGTRNHVESIIIRKNGNTQKSPTLKTNYLVIGLLGSTDWIHSTHGRKIEKAVEIQPASGIKIVSEEYWSQFI